MTYGGFIGEEKGEREATESASQRGAGEYCHEDVSHTIRLN